ncbi:MAG: FecR domain-containing protein [Wujia sp.]
MEKKKQKWWIIAIAVAVLAVATVVVVLLISKKKDSYRVIKVYEVEGTAFIQRDGIDDLEPYANMLLESGDTVCVNEGSMTLKLDEDKYVYVEPDTELCLVADGTSDNSKTTIELKKGAITNEIQDKLSTESSYEVNTPNSTMAVRGTIFRVEITYDENGVCYTKVSTLEGKVVSRLVYADGTISDREVMVEGGFEVIIYQDEKSTDYLTEVSPIDFSKLPKSIQDKFENLIEDLKEQLGLTTEDENKKSEYTVTFMYNGSVFGTQVVKAGACATQPSLMPAASGSWDFDFTKPIEEDITIQWK